jgi:hypothetical protein
MSLIVLAIRTSRRFIIQSRVLISSGRFAVAATCVLPFLLALFDLPLAHDFLCRRCGNVAGILALDWRRVLQEIPANHEDRLSLEVLVQAKPI